ncbi:MAG: S1 family peptidase [Rickettsiales bacterium]|jgi:hypothetical protein|nr:S1 family peptidase [Rickettsiales bacterium]
MRIIPKIIAMAASFFFMTARPYPLAAEAEENDELPFPIDTILTDEMAGGKIYYTSYCTPEDNENECNKKLDGPLKRGDIFITIEDGENPSWIKVMISGPKDYFKYKIREHAVEENIEDILRDTKKSTRNTDGGYEEPGNNLYQSWIPTGAASVFYTNRPEFQEWMIGLPSKDLFMSGEYFFIPYEIVANKYFAGDFFPILCGVEADDNTGFLPITEDILQKCDGVDEGVALLTNVRSKKYNRDYSLENYDYRNAEFFAKMPFKYVREYTPDHPEPIVTKEDKVANLFLGLIKLAQTIKSNVDVVKGVAVGGIVVNAVGTGMAGGALGAGLYRAHAIKKADAEAKKEAEAAVKEMNGRDGFNLLNSIASGTLPEVADDGENEEDIDEAFKEDEPEDAVAELESPDTNALKQKCLDAPKSKLGFSRAKWKKKSAKCVCKSKRESFNGMDCAHDAQKAAGVTAGTIRTGLLFGAAVTSLVSALGSHVINNLWRGPEEAAEFMETYNLWLQKMTAYRGSLNFGSELFQMVNSVLDKCEPYDVGKMRSVVKQIDAAGVFSKIGIGTAAAGGVTSFIANMNSVKNSDNDKVKTFGRVMDISANILAGTTTVTSGVSTGLSIAMIATMDANIKMARECEKHTEELMKRHAGIMSKIQNTDPRRYLNRGEKGQYPWKNIVRLNDGCTGTLITRNLIITANHCVDNTTKNHVDDNVRYDFQYGQKLETDGGRVVWRRKSVDEDVALIRINEKHREENPEYYEGPFPEIAPKMARHVESLVAAGYGIMRVIKNDEYPIVDKIVSTVISRNPDYYKNQFGILDTLAGDAVRQYDSIPRSLMKAMNKEAIEIGYEPFFNDANNLKIQHGCSVLSLNSVTLMNETTGRDSGIKAATKNLKWYNLIGKGFNLITKGKDKDVALVYDVKTDCLIVSGNSGGPLFYEKGNGEYGFTGVLSSANGIIYDGNAVGRAGGMYIRPEAYYDAIQQHDK